jgi:hypothetical protein
MSVFLMQALWTAILSRFEIVDAGNRSLKRGKALTTSAIAAWSALSTKPKGTTCRNFISGSPAQAHPFAKDATAMALSCLDGAG